MPRKDFYTHLVYIGRMPVFGRFAYYVLKLLGVEIPRSVQVGENLLLEHGGFGVVVHPQTVIGDRVKLYPGVTLGRADVHLPANKSAFERIIIEDDVLLAPGSKVLGKSGELRVARGTIVAANAVLLQSTNECEIWAGIPAKCIGKREDLQ
jgi:serine O-acetyltransferase